MPTLRYMHDDKNYVVVLGHLAEECGELGAELGRLVAACGKTLRHGPLSHDPTVPVAERVDNIDLISSLFARVRDEMSDVEVLMLQYNRSARILRSEIEERTKE